ncbi:glycerate kinase [Novispirillum sp. DQ9]|uniref:glycerate kinase n=1 Tax=Novispirillum sp. DQ9 TaxID=3398612 RepID=UPI003C7CD28C
MRVVVAPDSFKGSLTSIQAAAAIAAGLRDAFPSVTCLPVPMADGGEGTVDAVVAVTGGEVVRVPASDPLGRPLTAAFGWVPGRRLAVVEMAAASGLPLLAEHERDPARATTFGTGQVVRAALDRGAEALILGLGGSATSDGGSGLLRALGARLLDGAGREVAGILDPVAEVDLSALDPRLRDIALTLACDVSNPLLGPQGAVAVFGPQKGVTPALAPVLEAALARFADALARAAGRDARDTAGAGAAGGLGFGVMTAAGGEVRSGFELIADLADLAGMMAGADLAVTGEGRLDAQSLFGKVPVGIARLGRRTGTPVAAFAGLVDGDPALFRAEGIAAVVPIVDAPMPLVQALADAPALLRRAARRFMDAVLLGRSL